MSPDRRAARAHSRLTGNGHKEGALYEVLDSCNAPNIYLTQSKAHGKTDTDTVFTFAVIRLEIVIVHIEI